MQSRWTTHKGVRIFISDFSNYAGDFVAVQAEADAIVKMLELEQPASVLSIAYVEGTFANEKTLRAMASIIPITNKYVKKRCVVGVRGFRKHLIAGYANLTGRAPFTIFDTLEEAQDFLARG